MYKVKVEMLWEEEWEEKEAGKVEGGKEGWTYKTVWMDRQAEEWKKRRKGGQMDNEIGS